MNLLGIQERFGRTHSGIAQSRGFRVPWWFMRAHPHIGAGGFSDLWVYYPIPITLALRAWLWTVRRVGMGLWWLGAMDIPEGAMFDFRRLTLDWFGTWSRRLDTAREAGHRSGYKMGHRDGREFERECITRGVEELRRAARQREAR